MKKNESLTIFSILFIFTVIFYSDAFSHYFFQDDWFHFFISKAQSLREVIGFFNPINKYDYQIYRPLSTQLFFFVYNKLFGYSHTIFQLIVMFLLSINSFLIFKIINKKGKFLTSLLISIFYIVHHQNIGIIYYLSTIQTSIAVLFTLLGLLSIKTQPKNWKIKTLIYYFLSLLSHEITILNSIIFAIILATKSKKSFKKHRLFISFLLVIPIILVLIRLNFVSSSFFENTHYNISRSPKTILNNLAWYIFWLLSLPEYVINFVGSGFKPLPELFGVFKNRSIVSIVILTTNSIVSVWILIKTKLDKNTLINAIFFLVSLLPVLLFPWHKYTYYLPIASIFFIFILNKGLKDVPSRKSLFILSVLIALAIVTNFIDRQTSSSFIRGRISSEIKKSTDFNEIEAGQKNILVANDPGFNVFSENWGSTSSQAKIILREDLFFKLLTNNPKLNVDFQDDIMTEIETKTNYDYIIEINKNW